MKSSSELFPVTLLSAELRGAWNEDVYRLKPNNSPDHSVGVALVRCTRPAAEHRAPVLWLPHLMTGRLDWHEQWEAIVPELLDQGHEFWFLEWRGQGASTANDNWVNNSVLDLAAFDVPAALAFVREQAGEAPLVVADRSAAQVWAVAQGGAAHDHSGLLAVRGSLLLWPRVGRTDTAGYVRAMGWEDRELEVSRHSVRRRGRMESINRRLFDELLFGRQQVLRRWPSMEAPAPFIVVENKSFERTTHRWLASVPGKVGRSRYLAPDEMDTALARRFLDDLA